MRALVILCLLVAACTGGDYRPARGAYNDGVAAIAASDWARAEEKLLQARSEAGVDPELRWRAAFNLGVAYAGHAQAAAAGSEGGQPDLERAMELYGTAATWFQDAARLRPDDEDAKVNLAIVRAKQQAIADELAGGEKALEARLDTLIDAQREVREEARGLLTAARAGEAVNPTALEDRARQVATTERALLADAGVIVDLAGAEHDGLAGKPEDQLTDEDRVRIVQLQLIDQWMGIARSAIADTRRLLDDGKLEDAHGRAEEAVEALKRAREQLLDPIAALQGIAGDEVEVARETAYLAKGEAVPPWLTAGLLGGRQTDVRSRLDELVTRLDAAAKGPAPSEPAQVRLIERVKVALPDLAAASTAMQQARDGLVASNLPAAVAGQEQALVALSRAIEQFLDLRKAIDLAWEEQGRVVALLAGEVKDVPEAEQSKRIGEGVDRNVARMALLESLIADERDGVAAAQAQQPDPAAAEQRTAQLDQAETLRAQAEGLLRDLASGKARRAPLAPAREAHAKLTELRTLFFSIVEHLAELIREQGETHDDTALAAGLDDVGRAPLWAGLTERQRGHGGKAQAIADALAAQADAAAQGGGQAAPGAPDPAEQARRLGEAAEEVRLAIGEMGAVDDLFTKAQAPDQLMSFDLTPALDAQESAKDHLEAALRILQPPPPEQQQQQDQQQHDQQQQDQQQQDQQQQQQQQQQQDQSLDRRRERVREREAERRRDREAAQHGADPVEKDW